MKVYIYADAAHEKTGTPVRTLNAVERDFFERMRHEASHVGFCQVRGCQGRADRVILVEILPHIDAGARPKTRVEPASLTGSR